ncbi:MAG: matrixin family metalloprotease [Lacipirellulaceae bacterium]
MERLRRSRVCQSVATLIACVGLVLHSQTAHAINVTIDYSYDTNNFFGSGNPSGAAAGLLARNALESAATFYSDILMDTFSEISTPAPFSSSTFNGVATWTWNLNFSHPATGGNVSLTDQTIPADEYRIYAGARSIGGNTLGIGGPGGFGVSSGGNGGFFTQQEIDQINQTTTDFFDAVQTRGEPSGFSRWGGSITFDRDSSTTWWYDSNSDPSGNVSDFYSVAIHELGHALGLGTSDNWINWVNGSNEYFGPEAVALFGGNIPLDCDIDGCGHWEEGTQSTVYGTGTPQETAMDPTITNGDRKLLTALDAAGFSDIGWSVAAPPIPGDFTGNGTVDIPDLVQWQGDYGINGDSDADGDADSDANDFLIWQRNWGTGLPGAVAVPEPNTLSICILAVVAIACMAMPRTKKS